MTGVVTAHANDGIRTDGGASVRVRAVLGANMHTVNAERSGEVRPVVDDQGNVAGVAEGTRSLNRTRYLRVVDVF